MSPLPDPIPGWYSPTDRIPRRDQVVRILTHGGVDARAQFVVAHTDAWPSGASWSVNQGNESLPFNDVALWSPDPEARPPEPEPAPEPEQEETSTPRPAILTEVLIEVERTGTVLRLLPKDQLDWAPHPSLPSLRVLSWRQVRIVARIGWILDLDGVEKLLEPDLPDLQTPEEIIATYAANEADVRVAVESCDAAALRAPWLLERNGEPLAQLPRGDALRTFGLTPLVYHRGEMALLLTALGLHVPHPYPLWAFADTSDGALAPQRTS